MKVLGFFVPALDASTHPQSQWIDGLRGIAAILVAINHIPWAVEVVSYKKNSLIADDFVKIENFSNFLGSFAVQIFFCITGMLFINKIITTKNMDWPNFYKKRIRRMVPAYVTACLFICLILAIFSWPIKDSLGKIITEIPGIFSFGFLPYAKINNIEFIGLQGIYWTLKMEWHFYFLLPVICMFFQKRPHIFISGIVIFAFMDMALTHNAYWVYFISGAISAPLMTKQFAKNQRRLGSGLIVICLILYALFWHKWHLYGMSRWLTMSVLFAGFAIARPAILSYRPLTHAGVISYSFYLLHLTVLFSVFFLPMSFGQDIYSLPITTFLMKASLAFVVIVVLACMSYIFVEHRFMYPRQRSKAAEIDNILVPTATN